VRKKTKEYLKIFIIAILLPLAVGGLSAFLTMGNMDIYKELKQPPLAPPAWLSPWCGRFCMF
jgi:tryptophan-rich sensory protein